MGTHLRVLSESYPKNTNKTGLDGFRKYLRSCVLDESSLSIGRVNIFMLMFELFVFVVIVAWSVWGAILWGRGFRGAHWQAGLQWEGRDSVDGNIQGALW